MAQTAETTVDERPWRVIYVFFPEGSPHNAWTAQSGLSDFVEKG